MTPDLLSNNYCNVTRVTFCYKLFTFVFCYYRLLNVIERNAVVIWSMFDWYVHDNYPTCIKKPPKLLK
jgi:hypothetical protein